MQTQTPEPDAEAPALAPSAIVPSPDNATRDSAASRHTPDASADDEAYLSGAPTAVKSIGHTSLVFKVKLTTGKKAAFKPASRRGPVRYKGEIAARRLALALELPNVPPALFRTFEAAGFAAATGGSEMLVKDGVVKGALIPWIDGLEFLALERAPLSHQWKTWLKLGASIPADRRELLRQLSTLVVFDFVTGNWDRYSGGNVGIDKATGTVLYIDNDGAFFEEPPQAALDKNKKLLEGVDLFSRRFVTTLRGLSDDALALAFGEESPGVALLSPKALAGVAQRRRGALSVIDAKVQSHGEEATLAFP